MEQLFVYGTLKDPKIQMRLLGRILTGVEDKLLDYTTAQLEDTEFLIAQPDPGKSIDGMVFALTKYELKDFDDYEGKEYARKKVRLESGRSAWVYMRP